MSGLARALTDSGIQTRGKREASSGDSSQLVVICHIDTIYKSNEPMNASRECDRVPMVHIDGGTMSFSNAGPAEGKA